MFNSDGSIQALTCGPVHTTVLTDAVLSSTPTADGFSVAQDVTSTRSRGQSFQISNGGGNLTSVTLTLFQTDIGGSAPHADLTVSLYDVTDSGGRPGSAAIAQATVPQAQISWSPKNVPVSIPAALAGT